MSVADMLAAARGEKSGGAAASPKADKPKAAAAKAKAEPAAKADKGAAKSSGPKDTQSILAAARKGDKSGPVSKAEAAASQSASSGGAAARVAPPMPERPAYVRAPAPGPRQSEEN
ncbi:MAG: hypothetical protein KDA41_12265, partial [Planctomycetales bacterium]|nr:hypothetical protein [Planctomycetales bacterium]